MQRGLSVRPELKCAMQITFMSKNLNPQSEEWSDSKDMFVYVQFLFMLSVIFVNTECFVGVFVTAA